MNNNVNFSIEKIRSDFPCFANDVNGKPLIYLDTAASAQKPKAMLDCLQNIYKENYANVHRGLYYLSANATSLFEKSREKIAAFINASNAKEIVFTKSTTESINLVAESYGCKFIKRGDEIIISHMEHHANIVPWQELCKKTGAILKIIPVTNNGELDYLNYTKLLSNKTKLVAITAMSNVLGTITQLDKIIKPAHQIGAKILLDASQLVVHQRIDVKKINCDFLVFSAHKLYGPNGVGILYGKYNLLDEMPPYQTGGEMISEVDFSGSTFLPPPLRFEAGTPAISEVIAFASTIDYLTLLSDKDLIDHEDNLLGHLRQELKNLNEFKILGDASLKKGLISFTHERAHPSDIATILDNYGIAIRTGHLCAQPLMKRFSLTAVARVSIGIYNNHHDIECLIKALQTVNKIF